MKNYFYTIVRGYSIMTDQNIVITDAEPVTISQTTDIIDGQEIQTVIVKLEEEVQTIEFD